MSDTSIEAKILEQGKRIDPLLAELLPSDGPAHLAEHIAYHMETGGKRIRPALCLMTCEALGGNSEAAIPFAAAVELLHNMFLLHDDIQDGDEMRRNQPSLWKAFGVGNAINAGDYLLGRALQAVLRCPVGDAVRLKLLRLFLDTYERTVEGQALDLNARSDPHWGVERYMVMAELKTGHYLALGMVGGAIVADAPEATVECLRRMGENMGPAFQIRDDTIDLTAGKGRGGMKGCDIREGKPSILYAHALSHSMPAEQERLLQIMACPRGQTTEEDVAWVETLYERCGSVAFARETADKLIGQALDVLGQLPVEQQSALRGLVTFMAERTT